jgi:hypothetical protein
MYPIELIEKINNHIFNEVSKCCDDKMIESGQCLNCGANGKKIICPVCKEEFEDELQKENIEETGMCMMCEEIKFETREEVEI